MIDRIEKTDAEWRAQLTPEQYRVTREKGTEPAFAGPLHNHKDEGVYRCVCCGLPLFASDAKYDSGSGWPSFWHALDDQHIEETVDHSHGMIRTEIACRRCGAHLGHVFPDGPPPTGQRFCVNSLALAFEKTP